MFQRLKWNVTKFVVSETMEGSLFYKEFLSLIRYRFASNHNCTTNMWHVAVIRKETVRLRSLANRRTNIYHGPASASPPPREFKYTNNKN